MTPFSSPRKWHPTIRKPLIPAGLIFITLLTISSSTFAEVRTITATGEYRMGDNDTRTDAKRLALLDAKRLALEKAGTYLESVTEIKNLQVTRDELRAYTAGIVEVTEHSARTSLEGETTVLRVDVTARIDTDVVTRQIEALKQNEGAKVELVRFSQETERLRRDLEAKTQELAALKSKAKIAAVAQQRQQVVTRMEADELLARAWASLSGSQYTLLPGATTVEGRNIAKALSEQALEYDPANPFAHRIRGIILFEEGSPDAALREFHEALRLKPDYADAHQAIATVFYDQGNLDGTIAESRAALRLKPDYAKAHHGLGAALHKKGDLDGAIAEYRAAISLKPDFAVAHLGLGAALASKGYLAEGARETREGLKLLPDIPQNKKVIALARENLRGMERSRTSGCATIANAADSLNAEPNSDLGIEVGPLLLMFLPLLNTIRKRVRASQS